MKNILKLIVLLAVMIFAMGCKTDKMETKKDVKESTAVIKISKEDNTLNLNSGQEVIAYYSKKTGFDYTNSYCSDGKGSLAEFASLTPLNDEEVKYLCYFPNIDSIRITGKGITDGVLRYFSNFKNLGGLNLRETSVTGEGFKYLKNSTKLDYLNFEGSPIGDIGCKYLSEIKFKAAMVELNLKDTQITDEGLKYLSKIKLGSALNLINTNITDEGLKYLVGQNDLVEVFLNETKVTKKGAEWLMKKLPNADISYGKLVLIDNGD